MTYYLNGVPLGRLARYRARRMAPRILSAFHDLSCNTPVAFILSNAGKPDTRLPLRQPSRQVVAARGAEINRGSSGRQIDRHGRGCRPDHDRELEPIAIDRVAAPVASMRALGHFFAPLDADRTSIRIVDRTASSRLSHACIISSRSGD